MPRLYGLALDWPKSIRSDNRFKLTICLFFGVDVKQGSVFEESDHVGNNGFLKVKAAEDWKRKSFFNSAAILRICLWKRSFLMMDSVGFRKRLILQKQTVPGHKRWGFLPPQFEAVFFAAMYLRALSQVFLLAVWVVLYSFYLIN